MAADKQNKISIRFFNDQEVRAAWDYDSNRWLFSVVDVIAVLTDSKNPRNYWKVLKHRLTKAGNELVTNCNQLKPKTANRVNIGIDMYPKTANRVHVMLNMYPKTQNRVHISTY
ncbi:MAG: hypothetical protein PUB61_00805 [Bacteroidales bacterium]|nr:hypothetical protein [Bacteroidales bacterium]